jgi:phospholipid/cholesterol/gamma-HCH transport system permease protein
MSEKKVRCARLWLLAKISFDLPKRCFYLSAVQDGSAQAPANLDALPPRRARAHRRYVDYVGRRLIVFAETLHGLVAFALITIGVIVTKFGHARQVVFPLILLHIHRSGVRLFPMVSFLAIALGLVIIGQTVFLLTRVGAQQYVGPIMVTVVVRELGPVVTALLVLGRIGTAYVVELGTARAMGEVEALESLGVDPVHYLVVPRVIGMALSIFSLTVYLIIIAVVSGYMFAFLQDVPLQPADYFSQLAGALRWQDFVLLSLKTLSFGAIIAVVTCYQGLAQPLRIEDVPGATTRAVAHSVVACVLLDAVFILVYLFI